MARNLRQSKILELISVKEIETQDELVEELKAANFNITQATISRDIKELGLIKILTDGQKYKYSVVGASAQAVSSKYINIANECIISIKNALNLVVLKTIKGTAAMVSSIIDQLSLSGVLGCTYGDDTVMIITTDAEEAYHVQKKLTEIMV